jgi:hypothetical protein
MSLGWRDKHVYQRVERQVQPTLCIYKTDIVVRLLSKLAVRQGRWSTLQILSITFLLYFLVPTFLSLLEGTAFDNDPKKLAFFDDYLGVLNYAAIYPLLFVAVINYYDKVAIAFAALQENGTVLGREQGRYKAFVDSLDSVYNRGWTGALPCIVVIPVLIWYHRGFIAVGALQVYGGGGTGRLTLLGYYWLYVMTGSVFYILVSILIRHLLTIHVIWQLCDTFDLDVRLRDYDNAGGLGPIGNISIAVAWVAVCVGVIIASYTGLSMATGFAYILLVTRVILSFTAYIALVPPLLLAPIWKAHQKMVKVKRAYLNRIAGTLHGRYRLIWNERVLLEAVDTRELTDLENLDRLYSILDQMPVWPLDIRSVRVALTTMAVFLSPLVTSTLKYILKLP